MKSNMKKPKRSKTIPYTIELENGEVWVAHLNRLTVGQAMALAELQDAEGVSGLDVVRMTVASVEDCDSIDDAPLDVVMALNSLETDADSKDNPFMLKAVSVKHPTRGELLSAKTEKSENSATSEDSSVSS